MDTVTFEGYVARVEFDEGCGAYFGCVINLSNPLTFMATRQADIAGEFAKAVRAYVEDCKTQGADPEEPGAVEY